jgi:hypothetical protein
MDIYFYRTNNIINGNFYYGSHECKGRSYIGSGIALKRAVAKYGLENFDHTILKRFKTREEAFAYEDRFLKLYKISSLKNSYNIKDSGEGGDTFTNSPNKEERRLAMSEIQKKRLECPDERAKCNAFKDVSTERLTYLKETWSKASTGHLNGRAREVYANGNKYDTIEEAAIGEGLTRQQVKYRLAIDTYPEFY